MKYLDYIMRAVLVYAVGLASGLVVAALLFGIASAPTAAPDHSARIDALLCWHEFQSGRRPTSADCPEL